MAGLTLITTLMGGLLAAYFSGVVYSRSVRSLASLRYWGSRCATRSC
jgi:hypothetical protein